MSQVSRSRRPSGPARLARLRRLLVSAAASLAVVGSTAAAPEAAALAPPPVRDEDRAPSDHLTGTGTGAGSGAGAGARTGTGTGRDRLPGIGRDHLAHGAAGQDRLVVTVRHAGRGADGTYVVRCHPSRGSHPDARGACAVLDRNTRWGRDTFAPVPEGSFCTMQYGGPATAHVTGTWAGRPVDAWFDRGDGCRIARWDRFVPLLPALGSRSS
ncbi:hypothetical protein F7R91_05695 [Streptomyces luteolifulvus]|uniref:Subtilisin inhibitor domain-containing protein n=1 Tax=Streptomyces luteolifulvus TaxID=2615112 RepID=A0A6H9V894_9ACTN|nr:SSI family serine proteinase inhibitor [Streptomyces luteolifulvus]KAB1149251.1 hypothetical protein F7R91_05695 [Streptomyces luteolifulvus]